MLTLAFVYKAYYVLKTIKSIIKQLAGEKTYEKGCELFNKQAVVSFNVESEKITAQVFDNYIYDVKLSIRQNGFDGGCGCSKSEWFEFCEHCVAVCLYYEQVEKKLASLLNGNSKERIAGYLETLSKQELTKELHSIIVKDRFLLEDWKQYSDIYQNKFNHQDFQKRIIKALPLRDVWRANQVKSYFDKAYQELDRIFCILDRLKSDISFDYLVRVTFRYDKIIDRIDDADGYRFKVLNLIESKLTEYFQSSDESPTVKLARLLKLLDSQYVYLDFGNLGEKLITEDEYELKKLFFDAIESRLTNLLQTKDLSRSERSRANTYSSSLANYYFDLGEISKTIKFTFLMKFDFLQVQSYINILLERKNFDAALLFIEKLRERSTEPDNVYKIKLIEFDFWHLQGNKQYTVNTAFDLFKFSFQLNDYLRLQKLLIDDKVLLSKIKQEAEAAVLEKFNQTNKPNHVNHNFLIEFYIVNNDINKALDISKSYEIAVDNLHDLALACLSNDQITDALTLYSKLINAHVSTGLARDNEFAADLIKELIEHKHKNTEIRKELNEFLNNIVLVYSDKLEFLKLLNKDLLYVDKIDQR